MRWVVDDKVRAVLYFFTGTDMCGNRAKVEIFPSGVVGDVKTEDFRSLEFEAPEGMRVIFCASAADEGWEARPWRVIDVRKRDSFKTPSGMRGIRVPDLDLLEEPNALRTDPDFTSTFPQANTVAEGKGWTFGNRVAGELKRNVHCIRIERLEQD